MMNNKPYIHIIIFCNLITLSSGVCLAETPYRTVQPVDAVKSLKKIFILSQQQWSIPKNARSILKMPPLNSVMKQFLQKSQNRLVIRYPGGEVGILWASELKAWLVSLGISSDSIELQTGSPRTDQLQLFINN